MGKVNWTGSAAIAACLLTLGGCGGGGGAIGVASTPPPAPTPTPTPPPQTPAAVPFDSYQGDYVGRPLSITGDVTTSSTANGVTLISSFTPRQFPVGPGTDVYTFRQIKPGVYTIDVYGFGGSTFTLDDSDPQYRRASAADCCLTDVFQIARPTGALDLTYTRLANYAWVQNGTSALTFFPLGVPATDIPKTGTATYSGFVDGLWFDGSETRRLWGSTSTLNVDFAAGQVTTTLDLAGHSDPFGEFATAPTTSLGSFTATGTLSNDHFSGPLAPSNGYTGAFYGNLFGVQAAEFGFDFLLNGSNGAIVEGATVGKR